MLVCSLFLPHFLIYWALLLAVNCQQVHNEDNNYDVSLRKSWWGKNITFPSDRVGQIQLSFQNFPRRYVSDPSPNCIDKFQQRFGQILDRAPSAGCCQHKLPIRAKCERGTEIAQKCKICVETKNHPHRTAHCFNKWKKSRISWPAMISWKLERHFWEKG